MESDLNETEDTLFENELVGEYRDRRIELGFHLLATMFFALALFPALTHRENTVWGVLFSLTALSLSVLVVWKSPTWYQELVWIDQTNGLVRKFSAVRRGYGENEVLRTWETVLEDIHNISAVAVKPRRSLWNPELVWNYPVVLISASGKEIVFANDETFSNNCAHSNYIAGLIGEALECEVYPAEEEVPQEISRRGRRYEAIPKSLDLGPAGHLAAWSMVSVFTWGMWKLWTLPL